MTILSNCITKKQANKARKLVRQAKREFESKIAKNIKKDSKSFFKYVRSKSNAKSFVDLRTDEKGNLISDDKQMGELLNTFFSSVFTNETTEALPTVKQFFNGDTGEKLCDVTITPNMVYKKLNKLKMNKAPGVDFVGTKMLVKLSDVVSEVVAIWFNKSIIN